MSNLLFEKYNIKEGIMETQKYDTYYRIVGDLTNGTIPLVLLHGGPGSTFRGFEIMYELSNKGIPLVLYNQHGSYNSKVKVSKEEAYTMESFEEEIDLLMAHLGIKKFNLLGHSWGGMLALSYAINKKPKGLNKLVLFSASPSTKLWNEETKRLVSNYTKRMKEEFEKNAIDSSYSSPLLKKALNKYLYEHILERKEEYANGNCYKRVENIRISNSEVYEYMWGKSEMFGDGTLKDFDLTDRLNEVNYPTLLISGQEDESTPYINKVMNDNIKDSKWVMFQYSRHCSQDLFRNNFNQIVKEWLYD